MKLVQPNWTVPRLADPRHLGQTQFLVGHKAQLSSSLFPHHTTQADKRKAQIILAADLKNRSQCIFDHVHRACQGEASKMKKVLPKVAETVLNCYAVTSVGAHVTVQMARAGGRSPTTFQCQAFTL
ncbi:hypothetical protein BaRGS_00027176 [Batillaria attramentaria]|uniref:Uncharacterized protein n=1 Tax=Batillaria attramentaria TaxID=370345 RepID=A0ABD0K345_9CAEN